MILRFEPSEIYTRESFRIGTNHHLFVSLFGTDHLWLYGEPAVGKTHALHLLVSEHDRAVLISDRDFEFTGLEEFSTVVLDDFEQWIGDLERERAVYELFEKLHRVGHRLVGASQSNVGALDFKLPDLQSRVSMFSRVHLLPLPRDEQQEFLQDLVARHGNSLAPEVARFLLRHLQRTQAELVRAASCLNQESTIQNRHITVPLVKEIFAF